MHIEVLPLGCFYTVCKLNQKLITKEHITTHTNLIFDLEVQRVLQILSEY